jgi:hypothetical protein
MFLAKNSKNPLINHCFSNSHRSFIILIVVLYTPCGT